MLSDSNLHNEMKWITRMITVTRVEISVRHSRNLSTYYFYCLRKQSNFIYLGTQPSQWRYVCVITACTKSRGINRANKMSCRSVRTRWKEMVSQLYCSVEMWTKTATLLWLLSMELPAPPPSLLPPMMSHSTIVWPPRSSEVSMILSHTLADQVFVVM